MTPLLSAGFAALATAMTMTGVLAQSIPTVLPNNWTSVGCFSDTALPRTLGALITVEANTTIESCIGICDAANFIFAGVEFGHCDSAIQLPGAQVPDTDCFMACSGDATELCGGPSRLNVFNSGKPPPQIVEDVVTDQGTFNFTGCFTDTPASRTLGFGINIPGGTTAESCTAACTAAGSFTNAGLENGHECWCGNAISDPAQPAPDSDCLHVCEADHTEFCGGSNRIAVYTFTPVGVPPPQACDQGDVANFTLVAEFTTPPQDGPGSVNLKVIAVEIASDIVWTLLTACSNCCSEWLALSMQNSIIFPHSIVVGTQIMSSSKPVKGESPSFVASVPAFPGFQAFCSVPDTSSDGHDAVPALLAFNGVTDAFSLCVNNTANARVDLVFSPVSGHPHYSLDSCNSVDVKIITG